MSRRPLALGKQPEFLGEPVQTTPRTLTQAVGSGERRRARGTGIASLVRLIESEVVHAHESRERGGVVWRFDKMAADRHIQDGKERSVEDPIGSRREIARRLLREEDVVQIPSDAILASLDRVDVKILAESARRGVVASDTFCSGVAGTVEGPEQILRLRSTEL